MIKYKIENNLSIKEFIAVLKESTLGERRPIGQKLTIKAMLENAAMIITARSEGRLVGVARSISDFVYCTYLSDLAVSQDFQKMGIGKELIRQTKLAIPQGKLILLSAPAAVDYYPKIGMTRHSDCYFISELEEII